MLRGWREHQMREMNYLQYPRIGTSLIFTKMMGFIIPGENMCSFQSG